MCCFKSYLRQLILLFCISTSIEVCFSNDSYYRENVKRNNDGICGIYEEIGGNKYKLACIKESGEYYLINLDRTDDKTQLKKSAINGVFKALSLKMGNKLFKVGKEFVLVDELINNIMIGAERFIQTRKMTDEERAALQQAYVHIMKRINNGDGTLYIEQDDSGNYNLTDTTGEIQEDQYQSYGKILSYMLQIMTRTKTYDPIEMYIVFDGETMKLYYPNEKNRVVAYLKMYPNTPIIKTEEKEIPKQNGPTPKSTKAQGRKRIKPRLKK